MLQGRSLSILGDSISTYKGVSNDKNANRSTWGNPYFYDEPFPLAKTYFMRVIEALGLTLCVNNAWSGGNLSGDLAFAGVRRAHALARDDGTQPDLILVFMGINDLGRRVPVSEFADAYRETLSTIATCYPKAQVCCVNLPDRDLRIRTQTAQFNDAITHAVTTAGDRFFVADLFGSPLRGDDYYDNTVDGLHPDEDGMRMIADVIIKAIKAHAFSF